MGSVAEISEVRKSLPMDGFSRWEDVAAFVTLGRESIRLLEAQGRFPRRLKLTPRTAVWSNIELHRWAANPAGYRVGEHG